MTETEIIKEKKRNIYSSFFSEDYVSKFLFKSILNEALEKNIFVKEQSKSDKRIKNYYLSNNFLDTINGWLKKEGTFFILNFAVFVSFVPLFVTNDFILITSFSGIFLSYFKIYFFPVIINDVFI